MISCKYFILLAMVAILCTGCGVSSFKAQNWNINDPNNDSNELYRSKNLSICRQQAQQLELTDSSVEDQDKDAENLDRYGNINRYAKINKALLISCMETKGYTLRELTSAEIFITMVTAPIILPLKIVGKSFDDVY